MICLGHSVSECVCVCQYYKCFCFKHTHIVSCNGTSYVSLELCVDHYLLGNAVAQWLRYCATNFKVAGLIPDGVIGIFHWHNPSDYTMALGSTLPLTEMSTRSISSE
jgi:hypothetical protein